MFPIILFACTAVVLLLVILDVPISEKGFKILVLILIILLAVNGTGWLSLK